MYLILKYPSVQVSVAQKMEGASQDLMVHNFQGQMLHLHVILFTHSMDQLQLLVKVMENGMQVSLHVMQVILPSFS